jgi:hypothetical protein
MEGISQVVLFKTAQLLLDISVSLIWDEGSFVRGFLPIYSMKSCKKTVAAYQGRSSLYAALTIQVASLCTVAMVRAKQMST